MLWLSSYDCILDLFAIIVMLLWMDYENDSFFYIFILETSNRKKKSYDSQYDSIHPLNDLRYDFNFHNYAHGIN